jgi:hypothetical protein
VSKTVEEIEPRLSNAAAKQSLDTIQPYEKAPEKKGFRMQGNGRYTIGGKTTNADQKRAKTRPNEGDEKDSMITDERGRLHC